MKNLFRSAAFASLLIASALGGMAMQSANAAVITWGAATTISGTSDVNTAGTLYAASSFGSTSVTVNGVTFAAWSPAPSGNNPQTNGVFTLNNGATGYGQFNAFGSASAPFSGLPTEYKDLLSDAIVSFAGGSPLVTISGLTSGQTYSIQFWGNESRGGQSTRTQTVDGITLDLNTSNAEGGVGQWISGTFTADAATQSFTVAANDTYYNAIQVRVVPEPSSIAGLGVLGAGVAAFVRRRLRAAKSAS